MTATMHSETQIRQIVLVMWRVNFILAEWVSPEVEPGEIKSNHGRWRVSMVSGFIRSLFPAHVGFPLLLLFAPSVSPSTDRSNDLCLDWLPQIWVSGLVSWPGTYANGQCLIKTFFAGYLAISQTTTSSSGEATSAGQTKQQIIGLRSVG